MIEVLVSQLLAFIGIYIIVTLALNIKAGHTGIPDFGHAMFFAVGGIVVGNLAAHMAAYLASLSIPPTMYPRELIEAYQSKGVHSLVEGVLAENIKTMTFINDYYLAKNPLASILLLVFAIIVAMILGGLLGWIASFPALRLRGEYLAILLLTTSEGLRVVMTYTRQVMGDTPTVGLSVPALFRWTGVESLAAALFTISVAIIVYILVEKMHNSPAGRLLRAVRDDEDAAKAYGRDPAKVRRDAMIVGSSLAALAGVLYSINPTMGGGAVAAESLYDRVLWTFWPWALMILGGLASNKGVVVATIVVGASIIGPIRLYKNQLVALLISALQVIASLFGVERIQVNPDYLANALEYLLIGLLIVLVLAFRPQGIIPEPPSRTVKLERKPEATTAS